MKNERIGLNFQDAIIAILGDEISLNTAGIGLYSIPITAAEQCLEKTNSQSPYHHNVLRSTEEKSNKEIFEICRFPC